MSREDLFDVNARLDASEQGQEMNVYGKASAMGLDFGSLQLYAFDNRRKRLMLDSLTPEVFVMVTWQFSPDQRSCRF